MITETAIKRARILTFWQNHGLEATKEAFNVSRATLFRWQKKLKEGNGNLEFINKESTVPKNKRKRIIDLRVSDFIINQRKIHPRLGKEKLATLLKEENIASLSPSTVGRIINDLKEEERLPQNIKLSFYTRRGNLIERRVVEQKKLGRKGYKPENGGDLLQLDTIVKFINGIKRYIITAIDLKSDFAFAYGYTGASSTATKDFF